MNYFAGQNLSMKYCTQMHTPHYCLVLRKQVETAITYITLQQQSAVFTTIAAAAQSSVTY